MHIRLLPVFILTVFYSCSYQYKIRNGDQAFEVKQYANAASFYKAEFSSEQNETIRAGKAYKLGLCAKYTGDYQQSLLWFRKAYDLNFGPDALREYALALKNNGEYEAAANAFRLYGEEIKRPHEVRKEINICNLMKEWEQSPSSLAYVIKELANVKGEGSSYGYQRLSGEDWVYVSERWNAQNKVRNKFEWTGRPFTDLMIYAQEKIQPFTVLNSSSNEGVFCYSPRSEKIFFTRCDQIHEGNQYCKIYESTFSEGQWSVPEELILFDEPSSQLHPAMHASDSIFVFSSDREGGFGKFDLYFVIKTGDEWSDPINFGKTINTEFDEVFPVWNGDTLYFSSSGLTGMGGLDIFKTQFNSSQEWSPPINLRNPINSEADDFHYYVDRRAQLGEKEIQRAFFSSNRSGAGVDKIYQVTIQEKELSREAPKQEVHKLDIIANIRFVEPASYTGAVVKLLDSVNLIDKKNRATFSTGFGKVWSLKLKPGETFEFVVTKPGYLNRDIKFQSVPKPELTRDSLITLEFEFELIPVIYNREFLLKALYYDFDKWDIREDAVPALQDLKDVMLKNPNIVVQIGSHTDCRGTVEYNMQLSEKRAGSAANWLVQNGIRKERISGKGFGASVPALLCKCSECTEVQHQANRRSTFQLIPPKSGSE